MASWRCVRIADASRDVCAGLVCMVSRSPGVLAFARGYGVKTFAFWYLAVVFSAVITDRFDVTGASTLSRCGTLSPNPPVAVPSTSPSNPTGALSGGRQRGVGPDGAVHFGSQSLSTASSRPADFETKGQQQGRQPRSGHAGRSAVSLLFMTSVCTIGSGDLVIDGELRLVGMLMVAMAYRFVRTTDRLAGKRLWLAVFERSLSAFFLPWPVNGSVFQSSSRLLASYACVDHFLP